MTPEEQLRIYEQDVNAEANIRDAITSAYQDLRPESELVYNYENAQFPSFYSTLNGYGTGAADLSPTTQLQNAWGEVGRRSTSANVARDVFNTRKAGMEDLIARGLNQWNMGYTGAQNAYERWWAQKQHEDQMRMARAQLAATQRNYPTGPTPEQIEAAWKLKVQAGEQAQREWNAGADAAWNKVNSTKNSTPASGYTSTSTKYFTPAKTTATPKESYLNTIVNKLRG